MQCMPCKSNYKCQHGIRKYNCKTCGGSALCEHGKIKYACKLCGGSAYCEHNIMKRYCTTCDGSALCEHNTKKVNCKICIGSGICEHGNVEYSCKLCGGFGICKHGRLKSTCKPCGGSLYCHHSKQKRYCKLCGGSGICEHNKQKPNCKTCNKDNVCEHGDIKYKCKPCRGSVYCEHDRRREICKVCKGSAICEHNKQKQYCKVCGGSSLCKAELCETSGNKKYDGYCLRCFVHLFPDKRNTRNYKTKEKSVVDFIMNAYPDLTWVSDKTVTDGCSKRRPDLLVDMGDNIIIIEVDENKHTSYDCSCENKRLMEISKDFQHRPIIFIRFNPDGYVTNEGKSIKSCWKYNKLGIMHVLKSKEKEWEYRLSCLNEQIEYWINNRTGKTIEVIELFY